MTLAALTHIWGSCSPSGSATPEQILAKRERRPSVHRGCSWPDTSTAPACRLDCHWVQTSCGEISSTQRRAKQRKEFTWVEAPKSAWIKLPLWTCETKLKKKKKTVKLSNFFLVCRQTNVKLLVTIKTDTEKSQQVKPLWRFEKKSTLHRLSFLVVLLSHWRWNV